MVNATASEKSYDWGHWSAPTLSNEFIGFGENGCLVGVSLGYKDK